MRPRLTSSSVVFLLLTLFAVGVAAVFSHPLLVYTAVFMITSNIALFIWAQGAVRSLTVQRITPKFGVATQPVEIQVRLTNRSQATRFGILGFDLHSRLTPGQEYSPVAFLEAPPDEPVDAVYSIVPARRGEYRIGPLYIYGGDPFGFYKCWSKVESYSDLLVLPCPLNYRLRQPDSLSELPREELETLPVIGNSTEFLGVREYREGEPPKRIHWRTSARLGRLISRQYELNVAAAISVLLLGDDGMAFGGNVDNPLEYSLTLAASLAFSTVGQPYIFHYLGLSGGAAEHHAGSGQRFYRELAIMLARFKGGGQHDWALARRLIVNHLPPQSALVVFCGELTAALQAELGRLASRFRQMTVVSFDRRSFEHSQPGGTSLRAVPSRGYRLITVSYQDDLRQVLPLLFTRKAPRKVVSAA